MRYLILLISTIALISCQSQTEKIKGEWSIVNLSEYPLSVTNYGDMTFDKSSKALFENKILTISSSDSTTENFNYKVEDGKLIIIYSDYGILLEIVELTETKMILKGGGFGNTEKERNRYFKLEFKKTTINNG